MIAVRPPEYFPRLSFLGLVLVADSVVLADTFQYSRQSFQNRTRLRTPQGWQWISVPLKGGQHGTPINEVEIDNRERWARKHWRSLTYNYSSAPFFQFYEHEIRVLLHQNWKYLGDLTSASVELLVNLFGLTTPIRRATNLERAPRDIADTIPFLHADVLLVTEETVSHDMGVISEVATLQFEEPRYRQNFNGFEAGMTALDLLFSYGPEAKSILQQGVRSVGRLERVGSGEE